MARKYLYIVLAISSILNISACISHININQKSKNIKIDASISNVLNREFLNAVNKVRSKTRKCGQQIFPAAPALKLNNKLNRAAYEHSMDMYENQFLEHISFNGDTLEERMQKVNFQWKAVGENIAYNQRTIEQVIEDWLSSPGHCSNLMSSIYTQTGIAEVKSYWTQVYATPK